VYAYFISVALNTPSMFVYQIISSLVTYLLTYWFRQSAKTNMLLHSAIPLKLF